MSRSAGDRGAKSGSEKPRAAEVKRTGRERIEKVGGRRVVVVVEEERRVLVWRVRRSRKGRSSILRYDEELRSENLCLSIGSANTSQVWSRASKVVDPSSSYGAC